MAIKKIRMKPPGYTDIVYPETSADIVIEDANHRFVTDLEKDVWNSKETTSGAQSKVDAHGSLKNNPHSVTKSQVGLGNVDNTSDANKPISSLQQAGLDLKADKTEAQLFKLTANVGLPITSIPNFNSAVTTGYYLVNAGSLNNPISGSLGYLFIMVRTTNQIHQTYHSTSNGKMLTRVSLDNGATWSAWKEIATAENAIVESGSNANGWYVKFGDGTCIAQHRAIFNGVNIAPNGWVNPFDWIKPVNFTNKNTAGYSEFSSFAGVNFAGIPVPMVSTKSGWIGTNFTHQGVNFSGGPLTDYYIDLYAIGRWK